MYKSKVVEGGYGLFNAEGKCVLVDLTIESLEERTSKAKRRSCTTVWLSAPDYERQAKALGFCITSRPPVKWLIRQGRLAWAPAAIVWVLWWISGKVGKLGQAVSRQATQAHYAGSRKPLPPRLARAAKVTATAEWLAQVADCLYGRVFAPEAERVRHVRTRRVCCGPLWARSSPLPTDQVDGGQILDHLCALNVGQRVVHRIFGEGIMLQIEGRGEFTRVHVNFDAVGEKWLMLNVAELVALD